MAEARDITLAGAGVKHRGEAELRKASKININIFSKIGNSTNHKWRRKAIENDKKTTGNVAKN